MSVFRTLSLSVLIALSCVPVLARTGSSVNASMPRTRPCQSRHITELPHGAGAFLSTRSGII